MSLLLSFVDRSTLRRPADASLMSPVSMPTARRAMIAACSLCHQLWSQFGMVANHRSIHIRTQASTITTSGKWCWIFHSASSHCQHCFKFATVMKKCGGYVATSCWKNFEIEWKCHVQRNQFDHRWSSSQATSQFMWISFNCKEWGWRKHVHAFTWMRNSPKQQNAWL